MSDEGGGEYQHEVVVDVDLDTYDPNSLCPMCEGEKAATLYCRQPVHVDWVAEWKPMTIFMPGPHLDRKCERCGFIWFELPVGATKAEEPSATPKSDSQDPMWN